MASIQPKRSDSGAQITSDSSGPGPQLLTASTLEGDKVVNRQNDTLGKIDEIMLDVQQGRIAYAVLSSGGLMGLGDKLFAIPWSALTLDADRKCFVLDVDKERLEQAPGFNKDHWPDAPDNTWLSSVYQHFGAQPYWQSRPEPM